MASAVVGSTAAMVAATAAKSAASAKTSSAAPSLASPFAGGFGSSLATSARKEWKSRTTSNGVKVQCMKVWPPYFNLKWETLSYLPPLTPDQMRKQVDYLLREGWVPCLEFDENAYIKRLYNSTPGYYDGRYWTMWKLPMFGCNDSAQVLNEVNECKKEYPKAFIRVIGFDSVRQVQCISFVVHKPF